MTGGWYSWMSRDIYIYTYFCIMYIYIDCLTHIHVFYMYNIYIIDICDRHFLLRQEDVMVWSDECIFGDKASYVFFPEEYNPLWHLW